MSAEDAGRAKSCSSSVRNLIRQPWPMSLGIRVLAQAGASACRGKQEVSGDRGLAQVTTCSSTKCNLSQARLQGSEVR